MNSDQTIVQPIVGSFPDVIKCDDDIIFIEKQQFFFIFREFVYVNREGKSKKAVSLTDKGPVSGGLSCGSKSIV